MNKVLLRGDLVYRPSLGTNSCFFEITSTMHEPDLAYLKTCLYNAEMYLRIAVLYQEN